MSALTRPAFHILLALAEHDLHGLGIADSVARTTDGDMELGPGTLYRTLAQLAEVGLVREVRASDAEADPRRKYYTITAAGRRRAAQEAARVAHIAELARERKLLPERA